MERNELKEKLRELMKSPILSADTKDTLFSALANADVLDRIEKEKEQLIQQQLSFIKLCIGKQIFWAVPGWKMETHTITGVRYEVYENDFFDKKGTRYKGTKQIVIEVDGDSEYLAANIGKNLFLDEKEAKTVLNQITR